MFLCSNLDVSVYFVFVFSLLLCRCVAKQCYISGFELDHNWPTQPNFTVCDQPNQLQTEIRDILTWSTRWGGSDIQELIDFPRAKSIHLLLMGNIYLGISTLECDFQRWSLSSLAKLTFLHLKFFSEFKFERVLFFPINKHDYHVDALIGLTQSLTIGNSSVTWGWPAAKHMCALHAQAK